MQPMDIEYTWMIKQQKNCRNYTFIFHPHLVPQGHPLPTKQSDYLVKYRYYHRMCSLLRQVDCFLKTTFAQVLDLLLSKYPRFCFHRGVLYRNFLWFYPINVCNYNISTNIISYCVILLLNIETKLFLKIKFYFGKLKPSF